MKQISLLLMSASIITSCTSTKNTQMTPPKAKKVPFEITTHNDTRVDDYFWMRLSDDQKNAEEKDDQTKEVIAYLEAENNYLEEVLKPTETLQNTLFNEIKARIKEDESSVPVQKNGYIYYTRFEKGEDYHLSCRKKVGSEKEEIMLNIPQMAKGHDYFAVGSENISSNNEILAYSVDKVSRRQYTLHFKNLTTGEILSDKIENTTGGATWANDNKTIFYTKNDPVTLRSYQIYKHILGTDQKEDVLVFEEKDETFNCFVYKTKSSAFIMIGSGQTLSTEYQFLDANNPSGEFKILQARERNHEYSIDHFEGSFYIVTNWEAKNFRLMKTSVENTQKENWEEVIPHREDVLLEGIDIFSNYYVVSERKAGLNELRIINWKDNSEHYIEFNDPTYTAGSHANPEFNTELFRYSYSSLTTPYSVYDFNMNNHSQKLLKQQEVLDENFKTENYVSERIFITARDGAKVPVSIVYKKGLVKDGNAPLLLYAYGSYGATIDPYFSSVRLSLLDRGFVYAIAHIRGGQDMGRHWYEDGKLLTKKNTFNDFIDCGEYLVKENYTSSEHLYAQGGSAGGLLMGAVLNMAPKLWKGVIAQVPFVDVVSTMLDESIPLTTGEFDEWGNPKDKEYYDYIKSYSPYDNVAKMDYPNILITTGYWDSQVQYWEPAKWIAKLRDYKTDDNILIMDCNMDVGHGGASGRFARYKEIAKEYAFLLYLEGVNQ
jgi:oligopeptidase B